MKANLLLAIESDVYGVECDCWNCKDGKTKHDTGGTACLNYPEPDDPPFIPAAEGYNYSDPDNPCPDTLYMTYVVMLPDESEWGKYESDLECLGQTIIQTHHAGTLPKQLYRSDANPQGLGLEGVEL